MNDQRNYDLIRRFINATSKNKNFEINFIENKSWSPTISFVIDVEKMDKNTEKYDGSYRAQFVKETTVIPGIKIVVKDWSIKRFANEMLKVLSLPPMSFTTNFDFINYEYLEEFEKKINKAIKKTSFPLIKVEFELDGSDPKPKITFYNLKNYMNGLNFETQNFINELQKKLDIDINQYSLVFKI